MFLLLFRHVSLSFFNFLHIYFYFLLQVESTRWTSELSVKNPQDLYSRDDVAALYSRIRDLLPAANQP